MSKNNRQQDEQSRQREQVAAKAVRNRDKTRQSLLARGRKLARRRKKNVERTRESGDKSDNSTTVSGHSTTPPVDSNKRAAARHSHSTVPSRPKGSTVPAAPRLYGLNLHTRLQSGPESGDETPTAEETPETVSSVDTTEEGEEE